MLQLGYRTTEELSIVAWTAFLIWLPKCRLMPIVCDLMTDPIAIWSCAALDVTLVVLSQVLPHTRLVKPEPKLIFSPDTPFYHRWIESFSRMTLMQFLRMLLGITLPLLGVMVVMHPASVAALCLLKKAVLLEERLWRRWCPEAYIIFISICLILFIARRSVFTQKVRKHDRLKKQSHAHFYYPSPAFNYGLS